MMTGEAQARCEVCDQTGARRALGLCVECLTRWQPDSAYDRAQLAFLFELSPWPRQLGNQVYTIRGEMNERRWSGLYVSYDLVSADNFRAPWQLTYDGGPGWTPIIRMRIWKPNRAGYLIGWCDFRKWQASAMWPEDQHSHAAEWERWEVGWRDDDDSPDRPFGERLLRRDEQDWLELYHRTRLPPGPKKIWATSERFESDVRRAVRQIRDAGFKVTRANVAEELSIGVETLKNYLQGFQLSFVELRRQR